jgi:GrpB-like predicted nucleotidyltransferase (UPF0157 family)
LSAKPLVDILVEVSSLEEVKWSMVPILEAQGYDYFWRASEEEEGSPLYVIFIKRDSNRNRTYNIHVVEKHFKLWDRVLFRDYLIEFPEVAKEYEDLKQGLAKAHPNNRGLYTQGKWEFCEIVKKAAREYYKKS